MEQSSQESLEPYFRGMRLWGDDFSTRQIEMWHAEEKEAYTSMYMDEDRVYPYHRFNVHHAFRFLDKNKCFDAVLGLGAADGVEFLPLIKAGKVTNITIIESSDAYINSRDVLGVASEWVKPEMDGCITFDAESFDLVTSFGALHHIPNVSKVVYEMARVLKRGGYAVIQEPTISMGDWTKPRAGLKKNERGIPRDWFGEIFKKCGLAVVHKSYCDVAPFDVARRALNISCDLSSVALIDSIFSRLFSWNYVYHRTKWHHKFAPRNAYYVLVKR